jgi:hypothetical protein
MHRRFDESLPYYAEALGTSRDRGDAQSAAWSGIGTAGALFKLGRFAACLETIQSVERWLARGYRRLSDPGSEFSIEAIRAAAWLRRGDRAEALRVLESAERNAGRSLLLIYHALPGYQLVAVLRLAFLEQAKESGADHRARAAQARRAVRRLERFASYFPIARPQALLQRGVLERLAGRFGQARRSWERAFAAAQRLDMRYEEALASYELGRYEARDARLRTDRLRYAAELFAMMGCTWELARAEAELQGPALAGGEVAEAEAGSAAY